MGNPVRPIGSAVRPVVSAAGRWRDRLRRRRATRIALQAVVFLLGLGFVGLGVVLVVLPGPLTIPPILLGLYLWSTEFRWAERLRDRAARQGAKAWQAARRRPWRTGAVTASGLVAAGAAVYAGQRVDVLGRLGGVLG